MIRAWLNEGIALLVSWLLSGALGALWAFIVICIWMMLTP